MDEAAFGLRPAASVAGNEESTARYYLHAMFAGDVDTGINALTAPESPAVVPEMRMVSVRPTPGKRGGSSEPDNIAGGLQGKHRDGATLVSFVQTSSSVPIFGSHAKVTLDGNRSILAATAQVASVPNVSPLASIAAAAALSKVADASDIASASLAAVDAPHLEYFQEEASGAWHLVYHFVKVPATPVAEKIDHDSHGHGFSTSPREVNLEFDYLVDAHNGAVIYYFSSNPVMAPPTPVKCFGDDELGEHQTFLGSPGTAGFEMIDPLRSIRTFDLALGDIAGPFPSNAITSSVATPWTNRSAVSAHVNAMRVQQFYQDVLGRNSIDDLGMELVSVVNCTYSASGESSPNWTNAVWYKQRMWYGQTPGSAGKLVSFSRLLDVIGHELTHGVTEHTAALVYKDLPGALNESFSDIFGVIINNWFRTGANSDVSGWSWEIGTGIRSNGLPLRDMKDPARLGHPVKMSDYVPTTSDFGGVHKYSNIHNQAAYFVLNSGASGARPISAADGAVLYYMALQRLSSMSNFSDARRALLDSAKIYYGDPSEQAAALSAIAAAYDKAEIT